MKTQAEVYERLTIEREQMAELIREHAAIVRESQGRVALLLPPVSREAYAAVASRMEEPRTNIAMLEWVLDLDAPPSHHNSGST